MIQISKTEFERLEKLGFPSFTDLSGNLLMAVGNDFVIQVEKNEEEAKILLGTLGSLSPV